MVNGLSLASTNTSYPISITAIEKAGYSAYQLTNSESLATSRAYFDVAELTGKSTLTVTFYVEAAGSDSFYFNFRHKSGSNGGTIYVDTSTYALNTWNTMTIDLAELESANGALTEFSLTLTTTTVYVRDITVS